MRSRGLAVAAVAGLAAGLLVVAAPPASALDVNVVVTITEVEALDEVDEPFGDADFFTVTTIDGVVKQTDPCAFEDAGDHIFPNWELSQAVDANAKDQVAIQIQIWDDDDPCPGGFDVSTDDDQVDISPGPGRALNLTVDLLPCAVSGEVTGSCNAPITAQGNSGDDNGRFVFSVSVQEPASAPGFRIRCVHSPLVPGGGNVTITATALDGALNEKVAETLEIYVTALTSATTPPPPSGTPAASASSNGTLTHTDGPFSVGFAYGCRAVRDGTPIWSGWRTVAPATVAGHTMQAVGVTGPLTSRLDIVLIADSDNYASPTDPAFLDDAAGVIATGFWGLDAFLARQDRFNFWVAGTMGDAEMIIPGVVCPHVEPSGWDIFYTFADAGAILHTDDFRDCAQGVLFSSEPTSFGTIRHEAGHVPFGLSDEYCHKRPGSAGSRCDGGYWENDIAPNVYAFASTCQVDLVNLGNPACQTFTSDSGSGTWSVSDPPVGDLMVDNTTPQAADVRRINWVFDQCTQASC